MIPLISLCAPAAVGTLPEAAAQTTVRRHSRLVPLQNPEEQKRTRQAIERGLRYLKVRQQASSGNPGLNGRIGARYSVATTSLAGLALLGYGVQPNESPHGEMLVGCVNYLLSIYGQRRDGFLTEPGSGTESGSRMHGHCYSILFLSQVSGSLPAEREREVSAVIRRGIVVIENAQSREGGWWYTPRNRQDKDEASVTICAIQALRAADNIGFVVDKNRIDRALAYVKNCKESDGSFRYSISEKEKRTSFALTAAAVSTLNATGVYESEELRQGLDYLRKSLSKHRRRPQRAVEEQFFFYGSLYAAQALFQEGGATWREWYPKMRDHLLETQDDDGGYWKSRYGDEYATAMSILILELPLGYLPIFQR